MIDLPKKADLALEVLCSLPPDGAPVPLSTLAADFGTVTAKVIRAALAGLETRHGVKVRTGRWDGPGNAVALVGPRAKAVALGEAYWAKMYGPKVVAV